MKQLAHRSKSLLAIANQVVQRGQLAMTVYCWENPLAARFTFFRSRVVVGACQGLEWVLLLVG